MPEIDQIKVIGAGGIGLHLLPPLCRFLNYHAEIDSADIHIIDGDEFEARNQERQAFDELGNKAEVTQRTYADEYRNLMFIAHSTYLTEDNIVFHIRDNDVIFCCVDNHSTRKIVIERCQELDDVVLISGGNDLTDGNVSVYVREGGEDITRCPLEVYPEIANPPEGDKNPGDVDEDREAGCDADAEAAPQIVFANNMIAALMCNAFYNITLDQHRRYGDVYMDIVSNSARQNERAMPREAARIA